MLTSETRHLTLQSADASRVAHTREDWARQMRNAQVTAVLDQFAAELTYATTAAERVALVHEYGMRLGVAS